MCDFWRVYSLDSIWYQCDIYRWPFLISGGDHNRLETRNSVTNLAWYGTFKVKLPIKTWCPPKTFQSWLNNIRRVINIYIWKLYQSAM